MLINFKQIRVYLREVLLFAVVSTPVLISVIRSERGKFSGRKYSIAINISLRFPNNRKSNFLISLHKKATNICTMLSYNIILQYKPFLTNKEFSLKTYFC